MSRLRHREAVLFLLAIAIFSVFVMGQTDTLYTNKAMPKINVTFSEPVTVRETIIDATPSIPITVSPDATRTYFEFTPQTSLSEGDHVFWVEVEDDIGNIKNFTTDFVTDFTTPQFTEIYPVDGSALFTQSPTFKFVTDEELISHYFELGRKSYHFSTSNDMEFTRMMGFSSDDEYTAYLFVADKAGNSNSETFTFTLVTEELSITLENPTFGISHEVSYTLIVRTNRRTYCNYSFQDFENNQKPFPTHAIRHELDVTLTGDTNLFISCADDYGYSAQEHFVLKFDDVTPTIEATVNPEIITEKTSGLDVVPIYMTLLTARSTGVNADLSPDPVICRYSLTSNIWEDMLRFHDYDEFTYSAFELVKYQNITHLENNQDYTAYVACMDLAGNIGITAVSFQVRQPSGPEITINYPRDGAYASETKPSINATTNMNAISCRYADNGEMSSSAPMSGSGKEFLSPPLNTLDVGVSYTFYVGCVFATDTGTQEIIESTTFIVDTTGPTLSTVELYDPSVSGPGITHSLTTLWARFTASDAESGIAGYAIEVYHKTGGSDTMIRTLESTSDEVTITGLTLEDGEKYYLKVMARNNADAWSTVKKSNEITVDIDTPITKECGDDFAEEGEACDGTDLNNKYCTDFDEFTGGDLNCDSTCEFSTADCVTCDGDGIAELGEVCDGSDLGGKTCSDLGFSGGTLGCSSSCEFDTTGCTGQTCDNDGTKETGEACDCSSSSCSAAQLGGQSCDDFEAFTGGDLLCDSSCEFDFTSCVYCDRDGTAEKGEACDGTDLDGKSCSDLGFQKGTLSCDSSCEFDTSRCSGATTAECNNNKVETGEACDGTDLNSKKCTDFDEFTGGDLSCDNSCEFSTVDCVTCDGDGIAELGEVCDGSDLDGTKCSDLGFSGGSLACSSSCEFDTTGCTGQTCDNDGTRETGEACDCGTGTCTLDKLGSKKCRDFDAFTGGDLGCSSSCEFDFTSCVYCDSDGKAEKGEACDGSDLDGKKCTDLGFTGGTLSCSSCEFDTSKCTGIIIIEAECNNDVAEDGEACDGTDLNSMKCTDFDEFTGGDLSCDSSCEFSTADCITCDGDGIAELGEVCDGSDIGTTTCSDLGFTGGTLGCSSSCEFDTTGCDDQTCDNDGTKETGEACDCGTGTCTLDKLGSKKCRDFDAFTGGDLGCSSSCEFDFTSCVYCDSDGKAEKGEACDGSDLDGKKCTDLGFTGGTLKCSSCEFDTSSCIGVTPTTCSNGVMDGDETDIDCGGSCNSCGVGDECDVGSDCDSGVCESGKCVSGHHCDNGKLDTGEADIDCGGVCLQRIPPKECGTGSTCDDNEDCSYGNKCLSGVCTVCDINDLDCDGILNDDDDDIDDDGKKNWEDPDDDDDGICDTGESPLNDGCEGSDDDDDGDGTKDPEDKDKLQDWCYVKSEDAYYPGTCEENGKEGKDVRDGDLDNDGIPNFADTDIDGDGLLNSDDPDDDNDGLCDTSDIVSTECSGSDEDDDNDGVMDSEDKDPDNDLDNDGIENEDDDDQDGDGVADVSDADNDNDGIPDTQDPDDDNDGIEDTQEDYDGDGMPDYWEVKYDFNPRDSTDADGDADKDGVPNLKEFIMDLDPINDDTDGDGAKDGKELDKGTDPLDPQDYPSSPWIWWVLLVLLLIILGVVGFFMYKEYTEYGSFDHLKQKLKEWWRKAQEKTIELIKKSGMIELLARAGIKIKLPEIKKAPPPPAKGLPPLSKSGTPLPSMTPTKKPASPQKQQIRSELINKFAQKPAVQMGKIEQKSKTPVLKDLKKGVDVKKRTAIREEIKEIVTDEHETAPTERKEEEWPTIDDLEKPFKSVGSKTEEPKKVHEVFEKLSNLKKKDFESDSVRKNLDALADLSGKKITPSSQDHLEHVLTAKNVKKDRVTTLMSQLAKGRNMTNDDHAHILKHLVTKRKIKQEDAFDVLMSLKKKKSITNNDHEDILTKLKEISNERKK